MAKDGFVNETEREAFASLKDQMRIARTALRVASTQAERAGFGDQIQRDLEEAINMVQYVRAEYDLV